MAVTAEAPRRSVGGSNYSENSRVGLNSATGTLVAIDGEEVFFPAGCRSLESQWRMKGDFYAEIKGDGFFVAGFGDTALAATKQALAKAVSA